MAFFLLKGNKEGETQSKVGHAATKFLKRTVYLVDTRTNADEGSTRVSLQRRLQKDDGSLPDVVEIRSRALGHENKTCDFANKYT